MRSDILGAPTLIAQHGDGCRRQNHPEYRTVGRGPRDGGRNRVHVGKSTLTSATTQGCPPTPWAVATLGNAWYTSRYGVFSAEKTEELRATLLAHQPLVQPQHVHDKEPCGIWDGCLLPLVSLYLQGEYFGLDVPLLTPSRLEHTGGSTL